jgi:hypothetical protein
VMDGLPELSVVAAPVDGGADDDDVPCAGLGWTLGKGTQLSGVVIGTHSLKPSQRQSHKKVEQCRVKINRRRVDI